MKKAAWQIIGELYLVLVILSVFTGISVPGYYAARWSAEKRACAANMRTLRGAYEMAILDKLVSPGKPGSVTQSDLQKQGYLKTLHICPSNVSGDSDYHVFADGSPGSGTVEVSCFRHGTLSLQETVDKKKGIQNPSTLGKIWIEVARLILLSLFIVIPLVFKEFVFTTARKILHFILKR